MLGRVVRVLAPAARSPAEVTPSPCVRQGMLPARRCSRRMPAPRSLDRGQVLRGAGYRRERAPAARAEVHSHFGEEPSPQLGRWNL